MNSLQAQTTLMSNAFKELGIVIGEIIAPALTSIVQGITKAIHGFTSFINKVRDTNKRMKENMEVAEQTVGVYGSKLPKAYNAYGTAVEESTEAQTDFRSATQKAIDASKEQDNVVTNYATTQDIINEALAKHVEKQKEVQEVTEDATEAVEEQAEELRKKSLPALNKVFGAYKKILDIQEDVADLANDVKDANKDLNKANKDLQIASDKVTLAEMELADAKEKSKKVTLEEEIAIERQRESIERLEAEEEKSKLQNLELALAKKRLTELIIASTGANNEEERAVSKLESALREQEKASDNVTKAQEALKEANEELAEATAHSTENILEMAIAKAELDNAIADVKSLGVFEDALEQMVAKTGGDIDILRNKFLEIFGLANQQITVPSAPSTSDSTVDDVVEEIKDTNEKLDKDKDEENKVISNASSSGSNLDRFLNSRFVETGLGSITMNINTGNNLDTKETISDSVAKALKEFNKRNGSGALGIEAL
jgi:chromosome segregation ATPase